MDTNAVIDRFVEQMADRSPLDGEPRTAGRIFALLLLSPGALSLDEISERLKISKGSASMNTRALAKHGFIERQCVPGDRRDFYGVGEDMYTRVLESRLEQLEEARQVFTEIGRIAPRLDPVVRHRLLEIATAYLEITNSTRALLAARRELPSGAV